MLEELLNKLLERGWKPRGYNDIKKITVENNKNVKQKVIHLRPEIGVDTETLTRFLTVKESLLRQFVCEKGMVIEKENEIKMGDDIHSYDYISVEYRLIESSLKNEDELEQFLLDNIQLGE